MFLKVITILNSFLDILIKLIIEFNFLVHDSKQVDFAIPDGNYNIFLVCNQVVIYYLFILIGFFI